MVATKVKRGQEGLHVTAEAVEKPNIRLAVWFHNFPSSLFTPQGCPLNTFVKGDCLAACVS